VTVEYKYVIRFAVSQKTVGAVYAANATEAIERAVAQYAVKSADITVQRTSFQNPATVTQS
jgi:hypothetical protein